MTKCAKCELETGKGNQVIEGGTGYVFCQCCADILKENPKITIQQFLGPKKETWVEKNMRGARKNRAQGKSLWQENAEKRN